MTPEEQSHRDRSEIKIQKVTNGFILRLFKEWYVYSTLDEVFARIRTYYGETGGLKPIEQLVEGKE